MKKKLLLSLFVLAFGAVNAQEINIDKARSIAMDFFSCKVAEGRENVAPARFVVAEEPAVAMAYAPDCEATGTTAYYLFNRTDEGSAGFVIVSGNDGRVLGYSHNTTFDYDTAPDDVKSLLDMLANNHVSEPTHPALYANLPTSVAPLLKSKWDQLAPYNLMCPSDGKDNAVTGCGATCIAQIAYYYRYPFTGTGSNSYVSGTNGFSCSYDFSQAFFDYESMTDTYDKYSTEEQKSAVANLMYAAGVAVNMDYKIYPRSSTCTLRSIAAGLINYFRYDSGLTVCYKDDYTLDGWKEMLCTEVSEGRPVVYQGIGARLGHVFMLDGYDSNRLFHINWGWGGAYDGYYDVGNLSVGDYGALDTYLWVIKGIKPAYCNPLAEEFASLRSRAAVALDSCSVGNKLITSDSQFSSPYTEATEGSIKYLLDNNQNTFWHSTWMGGAVADGVHYIEISLPEGTSGHLSMHFGRRSDTNWHHLTKARVLGVVSGGGTSAVTEPIAELDMPFVDPKETVVKQFAMPKAYPSIRLVEMQTTDGAGYFHIGELQFYSSTPYYVLANAQAEADALSAAMKPSPEEVTQEDFDKLQAAYDTFMYKVFGIEPTGIRDITGNENGKDVIYDLGGRKVENIVEPGVYIVDGKKVFIKK